jgi:hypothetical protein
VDDAVHRLLDDVSWMTTRRRMVISVQPRLLCDALSRVLARDGVEIVVRLEPGGASDGSRYDVAIVSGELPSDIAADVVIRVPDDQPRDDERLALADLIEQVDQALT